MSAESITIPGMMFGQSHMGYNYMGQRVTTAHREGKRLREQQTTFERNIAEALDMDAEEVGYYFQRMRQDPLEGAHFNMMKNMMLQAKMIWGEEYGARKREERKKREQEDARRQMEIQRRENARAALHAWDIQCDEILAKLQATCDDYTPSTQYEQDVYEKLMKNGVLKKVGFFKRTWQAPGYEHRQQETKWPIPVWLHDELDLDHHITRRKLYD
jgi:hypothetical protein